MAGTCEVCSTEPSKYRCPTCGIMSCSLACTQSHKVYCAPKPSEASTQSPPPTVTDTGSAQPTTNGHGPDQAPLDATALPTPEALASSKELQELFEKYPQLRIRLRDIYKVTLEEEWIEARAPARGRGFGRGRGSYGRGRGGSRGPWTAEKGFKRGLGKVKNWRDSCEEGSSTGSDAEAFMKFVALVNGENST
ncbi:hypothetical protein Plec18167_003272 [Paecilomyces lecythidis]|uniref:HIT-type domain-containing protein n=1 Tax=Paecilomyces lecythidis TaxID=3004212 RepID=A0ABR3Y1P9_9EURO